MEIKVGRREFLKRTGAIGAAVTVGGMVGPFVKRVPAQVRTVRLLTTETDPNSVRVLKELIDEYQKQNPSVRLEPEFLSWGDMYPKVLSAIAAKSPPEVVYLEDVQIAKFAAEGLLLPVSDLVNSLGRDRFHTTSLKVGHMNNEDWAIPATLQSDATYYRADWYREMNVAPVQTWDDYLRAAKALTDPGKGRYGTNLPLGSSRFTAVIFIPSAWCNGARFFEGGKLVMDKSPHLERIAETLDFWKEASKYGPPGITEFTWLEVMQNYYTERNAHSRFAPRLMTQIERYAPKLLPPDVTNITDNPRGPNGPNAAYLNVKGYVFMKGGRAVDEAKKFIMWTMETERYIKYLHTVPGHMAPALLDVAKSEAYFNNPLMKANLPVQRKFVEIMAKPSTLNWVMEDGRVNLGAVQLLDGPYLIEMVQSVMIKNQAAKAAVSMAAQRIRSTGVA